MSAACVIDPVLDDDELTSRYAGRPRLRLVPTGSAVARTSPSSDGVRLSRAGRLVRAVVLLVLAVGAAALVMNAVAAAAASPARTVTVVPGDTLWGVASRELPSVTTADAVNELRIANHLPSGDIHAGQVLTIPAGG